MGFRASAKRYGSRLASSAAKRVAPAARSVAGDIFDAAVSYAADKISNKAQSYLGTKSSPIRPSAARPSSLQTTLPYGSLRFPSGFFSGGRSMGLARYSGGVAANESYGGKIRSRRFPRLSRRRVRRFKRRLRFKLQKVVPFGEATVRTSAVATDDNYNWCYDTIIPAGSTLQTLVSRCIAPQVAGYRSKSILFKSARFRLWFKNPYSFTQFVRLYEVSWQGAAPTLSSVGTINPLNNSVFTWPEVRTGELKVHAVRTITLGAGVSQKYNWTAYFNKHIKLQWENTTTPTFDSDFRWKGIILMFCPDVMTNLATVADVPVLGFPKMMSQKYILKSSYELYIPGDIANTDPRVDLNVLTGLPPPLTTYDVTGEDKLGDATL